MYTKDTWEYTEELNANFSMISSTNGTVICGLPNPVSGEDSELEEMRSNAQLIILAPRMHRAIRNLVQGAHARPFSQALSSELEELKAILLKIGD